MAVDSRHPREIRAEIRSGKLAGVTAGLARGFVQANLAALPREQAYDFLLFCQRNPRPCPLLEVTEPGSPEPHGVALRPIRSGDVAKAVTVTARFPSAHGAPVHVGDPAALGIRDLGRPDWGDPQPLGPGQVPVFWACGVTPQAVALASKPPFMITHSPGHMFITDLPDSRLAVL